MITFEKMTMEDAVKFALKENPNNIGLILNAIDGQTVRLTTHYEFKVPAAYAKFIAKEYVKEIL